MPLSNIPRTVSSKSFDELKDVCREIASQKNIVDGWGLKIVATNVVAADDFRHIFIAAKSNDPDIYVIRWVDEDFGHRDYFFSEDEIVLLVEDAIEKLKIQPGMWFTPHELSLQPHQYLKFDEELFGGDATTRVKRLVYELKQEMLT